LTYTVDVDFIKVHYEGAICTVEARFFFHANIVGTRETLVLCSLYSPTDEHLNRKHTVLSMFLIIRV
jgi:hypothetical protein